MSEGMGALEHCHLTLITVTGCPACEHVKQHILTNIDDFGIDVLHLDTDEKYHYANEKYPDINSVPSLVLECDGRDAEYISGVERIQRFVKQGLF